MRPNLFLVGAPKCGTSALHGYLAQHPDVWMSEPKEPHFFCTDVDAPFAIRDPDAYAALFKDAGKNIVGESSATYLYSKVAAQKIRAACPDAAIIAMLRNPLELIPSLHSQKRVNGTEPYEALTEALAAEPKRKTGELEAIGAFPFYGDAARYTEQLERYLDVFPPEQLHIIVFDDFKRDAAAVYAGVLEFLGLKPFTPNFKVVNQNKRIRSRALHNVLQNPASPINRLPKPLGRFTYKALDKLNSAVEVRVPLEPAVKDQLIREFTGEVESLIKLLRRSDLRDWLE